MPSVVLDNDLKYQNLLNSFQALHNAKFSSENPKPQRSTVQNIRQRIGVACLVNKFPR